MQIHLTNGDGVPKYLQIVQQVKHLIASGRLSPGEEIPTIRALAERLVINPNTVARAYRELETAGIVQTRGSAGTIIADGSSPLARRERLRLLTERVDALLAEAHQLDFAASDVIELIRRRDSAMPTRQKGDKP